MRGDSDFGDVDEGIVGPITELTNGSQSTSQYFGLETERSEGLDRLDTEREMRAPMVVKQKTDRGDSLTTVVGFVNSLYFENIAGMLVILNALTLGFETNYHAATRTDEIPWIFSMTEGIFCALFTLELVLRLKVYGGSFFTMEDWPWNVFDLTVVTLQVVEQASTLLWLLKVPMNIYMIRTLRIMRLIRITRIIRVLRLVDQLRVLSSCIMGSMKSLTWTLCLLLLIIYAFSVLFTQIVLDALREDTEDPEALEAWFSGLGRTALTLFESIMSGVSWDEVVRPLIKEVGAATGLLFCGYIALCVFALLNVVTGVFVEEATRMAQESSDMHLAKTIGGLFMQDHGMAQENITLEAFETKIADKEMTEYFKSINIDPSEAQGLFQLLDVDGSGDVDCVEIVNGLLRLRGNAKALELSLLMSEICRLHQRMDHTELVMEHQALVIPRTPHSPQPKFQSGNSAN